MPRRTTKKEEAEFLKRFMEDAFREWKVGDRCLSFKGTAVTTVAEVRPSPFGGNSITLADGTSGHQSRMRRA